jgi:hypothetical protein
LIWGWGAWSIWGRTCRNKIPNLIFLFLSDLLNGCQLAKLFQKAEIMEAPCYSLLTWTFWNRKDAGDEWRIDLMKDKETIQPSVISAVMIVDTGFVRGSQWMYLGDWKFNWLSWGPLSWKICKSSINRVKGKDKL